MLDKRSLRTDGTPIYVQLRALVLAMIGQGQLVPGQQVPTVRSLSFDLSISPGVVQQAYDELVRDGALVSQRGRGTFVAENPPKPDQAVLAANLELLAFQTVAAARSQGLDAVQVGMRVIAVAEDSS